MAKARKYYSLLTLHAGIWAIEFGSYVREEVDFEKQEFKDKGYNRNELKVITTSPKQADITAAVAKLNQPQGEF